MKPGSVIVDLAAETGGNCALTVPGETVVRDGVTIDRPPNLPEQMPFHASQMYSRNVRALLASPRAGGRAGLDFDDEITRETLRRPRPARCTKEADRGMSAELDRQPSRSSRSPRFLGIELISRVPALLHTPLMSGDERDPRDRPDRRDARSPGSADSTLEKALAFIAVVFGTVNVVGGFLVTDRMLDMFKRKPEGRADKG